MSLLAVKNLEVSFHSYAGEVQAVRGISFSLEKNETLAIVGESGCGKSVTAKALMGLIQTPPGEVKSSSRIEFDGRNILEYSQAEWSDYCGEECSIIFQDAMAALNPTMNIGKQIMENLLNHRKISKAAAKEKAIQMLNLVGIPDSERSMRKYPHELSGGQRQRIMIAIALCCDPKILIADEPTTALDVTIQSQIMALIKSLQHQFGTSVILITHDLGVVANAADKIVVMYCGKIVERGTCHEIFYQPRHPYTWALLKAVPRLDQDDDKNKLYAIKGTPPNLIQPPKGCPFAQRCHYCMNICLEQYGPTYEFANGHEASCWLHHPNARIDGVPFEIGGGKIVSTATEADATLKGGDSIGNI